MEEADKFSSSAPDKAPHEIAMNEAAAVGQTQTEARTAEEKMTEKTSPPQTTEETSPQTNEVTSTSQTTEETNIPQITEETSSPQTTEITSASQRTEEISIPQTTEITSSPQTTEETSSPQTTEVTSSPQTTEETSSPQTTEETSSPQTTEVTSSPQTIEVTSSPQTTEETSSPQITELTSAPEPAGASVTPERAEESVPPAVSEAPAEVKLSSAEAEVTSTPPTDEAAVTAEATEVTSSRQTEAREDSVTPVSAESASAPPRVTPAPEPSSSCAAHTDSDLSSEAPEEEEKHPHTLHPSPSHDPEPPAAPAVAPALFQPPFPSALELLHWRDVRSSALVFGSSLFILLSLTCCSIISVLSYAALALLSVTLTFRIYKGVLQAIQKSDEGHPFKWFLEKDVALSREAVQRHSDVALSRINGVLKELRRLFLVEDLVDSLKFAVLLWIFTYIGSWFNGLTVLILGLVGAFSGPITYEKHQTQIDQFISMVNNQMKDVLGKIQSKVPGAKKKPE